MIRLPQIRVMSVAVALACLSSDLVAQQVASRVALNGLLASPTIETFSGFTVPNGQQLVLGYPLNNASDSRFIAGATYASLAGPYMFISSPGYVGVQSQALLASNTLRITFDNFTSAFGLDYFQYQGFSEPINISVFMGGTLLGGCTGCVAPDAPSSSFFGWQNAGGITSVELSGRNSWSPIVDNVEWGVASTTVAPEPASLALVAAGLLGIAVVSRRRRSASS